MELARYMYKCAGRCFRESEMFLNSYIECMRNCFAFLANERMIDLK